MAQIQSHELLPSDVAILDELQAGARTRGAIIDSIDYHENTVGNRLQLLEANDVIECIHKRTALYELKDDPRGGEQ